MVGPSHRKTCEQMTDDTDIRAAIADAMEADTNERRTSIGSIRADELITWAERIRSWPLLDVASADEATRPHHLRWSGAEWVDDRCGCRYHPDDDNGSHGGAPHVHRCAHHSNSATPPAAASTMQGEDE